MSTLAFRALSGSLGGEVSGLDLSKPLDDETFAAIKTFWLERVVFVARGLDDLTPAQLVAFTRRFGEPHVFHVSRYTMPENPEVYVLSNVVENGKPLGATGAGTWWHTDEMYLEKPAHCTLLYGKEVPPEDGDTLFADMYAAYEALPAAMRERIDRLEVVVTRIKTYERLLSPSPAAERGREGGASRHGPPARTRAPRDRAKSAFCGGGEAAWSIVGLPLFEGQALLRTLRDLRPCRASFTRTNGGPAICSCGTTAARCTRQPCTTPKCSGASCTAPRSTARRPSPPPKPPRERCWPIRPARRLSVWKAFLDHHDACNEAHVRRSLSTP